MTPNELLAILAVGAKLKENTRHCWIAPDRKESVADHSWRLGLFAMLLADEPAFAGVDMNKVTQMCLIHDLGEAFTGDIPAFEKTNAQAGTEDDLLFAWVGRFPEPQRSRWLALLEEMQALETPEAQVYKALDKLEALISHNESDLSTWLPLEYELQLTYGRDNMQANPYFIPLREAIDRWTLEKIGKAP